MHFNVEVLINILIVGQHITSSIFFSDFIRLHNLHYYVSNLMLADTTVGRWYGTVFSIFDRESTVVH